MTLALDMSDSEMGLRLLDESDYGLENDASMEEPFNNPFQNILGLNAPEHVNLEEEEESNQSLGTIYQEGEAPSHENHRLTSIGKKYL